MSVSVECIVDCQARLGEGAGGTLVTRRSGGSTSRLGKSIAMIRQVVLTDFTTGENLSPVWRGGMPVGW